MKYKKGTLVSYHGKPYEIISGQPDLWGVEWYEIESVDTNLNPDKRQTREENLMLWIDYLQMKKTVNEISMKDVDEHDEMLKEFEKLYEKEVNKDLPAVPAKCCSEPTIIRNSAAGKDFFVCTRCKLETDSGGYIK
jgi:hypothetical protein